MSGNEAGHSARYWVWMCRLMVLGIASCWRWIPDGWFTVAFLVVVLGWTVFEGVDSWLGERRALRDLQPTEGPCPKSVDEELAIAVRVSTSLARPVNVIVWKVGCEHPGKWAVRWRREFVIKAACGDRILIRNAGLGGRWRYHDVGTRTRNLVFARSRVGNGFELVSSP